MSTRHVSAIGRWRGCALGLMGWVLAGCATHGPPGGTLLTGLRPGVRPPVAVARAAPGEGAFPVAGSAGGVGAECSPERASERWPKGAQGREEAGERARRVEAERAEALVRAAREEGREPEGAREAETERALAWMVGVASGVREVGARLVFTFWVHEGALTPLGYQEQAGGGSTGRTVEAQTLERVLRPFFSEPLGRRTTGEVVLTLRREEARWAVDLDATREGARPAEAKTLAVGTRGTPSATFLALHEAMRKGLGVVRVSEEGAARVVVTVGLEDGRLTGWELVEALHTRKGTGSGARALSPEVAGQAVQVVLPFTEGLGPRTVLLVLRVEHRAGEAQARGRVESARVERPSSLALTPEQGWYHAMHEALLLRWREGVYEGSAWLAEKGVEEAALWFVGGMVGKGLGSFMAKGLEWVPKALGREPEVAAGWLRSALKRLPNQEQKAFEQLWRKVALEGEQALSQRERSALRGLFVRLEHAVQEPLNPDLKKKFRQQAREYYKELHPQLARALDRLVEEVPIHHRRPLQYAHLFPADDINAAENLATLRKYVHDQINFLWGRFRKARPHPTADEVRRAAEIIDGYFEPWYHRVDEPPGLSRAAGEAREAALRELRSHFPGLE